MSCVQTSFFFFFFFLCSVLLHAVFLMLQTPCLKLRIFVQNYDFLAFWLLILTFRGWQLWFSKTSWYSIDVSGNHRHILLFYKKCHFCHLLPFAKVGQHSVNALPPNKGHTHHMTHAHIENIPMWVHWAYSIYKRVPRHAPQLSQCSLIHSDITVDKQSSIWQCAGSGDVDLFPPCNA